MNANWTYEHGHLLGTLQDGTRLETWEAPPPLAWIVDLLNACPAFGWRLLAARSGLTWSIRSRGTDQRPRWLAPFLSLQLQWCWSYFFDCDTKDPADLETTKAAGSGACS